MAKSTFLEVLNKVGPTPDFWIARYFKQNYHQHLTGLTNPPKMPVAWVKRLQKKDQSFAPWTLWSGLRALNLDTPTKILNSKIELLPQNSLAIINGKKLGLAHHKSIQHYLRLGDSRNNWLTPGTTLEEDLSSLGLKLKHNIAENEVPIDWQENPEINYQSMVNALDLEVTRAKNFIDADPLLGMTCLLGPLARRSFSRGERYRQQQILGVDGEMTKLAWWRLATTSRQGIGVIEKLREHKLPVKHRSWVHMRRIQAFALENWEKQGWIPIGLEYSGLSSLLKTLPHRYRPDLLMITPQNQLVWYEYMRRPLRLVKTVAAVKYIHLPQEFLPLLSSMIERPILFIYEEPHQTEEQIIEEIFVPLD